MVNPMFDFHSKRSCTLATQVGKQARKQDFARNPREHAEVMVAFGNLPEEDEFFQRLVAAYEKGWDHVDRFVEAGESV